MEQFDKKRLAILLSVGVLFLMLPAVFPTLGLSEATRLAVTVGSAMTLNLLVGSTGLLSMGQGLFFGLGAYALAIATIKFGVPYRYAILIGPLIAVPLSIVVALISLRARHMFFGLLTLAIGQVAYVLVARSYNLTGGDDGLTGVAIPVWLDSPWAKHVLAVTVLVLVCICLLRLIASPFGAMLGAVRENSDRVASLGGNPKLYEVAAMTIAGSVGSVFGVVAASTEGSVDPIMLAFHTSAMMVMMIALGGRSIFLGPLLGAVVLETSRVYVQSHSSHSDLVVGTIVILCAIVFPEGAAHAIKKLIRDRFPGRGQTEVGGALQDAGRGGKP